MAPKNNARPGLTAAREARGWTQQQLADEIGSTFVSVSRWETGARTPGPYFRRKLVQVLGKSEAELGLTSSPGTEGGTEEEKEDAQPGRKASTEELAIPEASIPASSSTSTADLPATSAPSLPLRKHRRFPFLYSIIAVVVCVAIILTTIKLLTAGTQTQSKEPTLPPLHTTCPAAGFSWPARQESFTPGHHQAFVYMTGPSIQGVGDTVSSYDLTTQSTTSILHLSTGFASSGVLSPDGNWILLVTSVSNSISALELVRTDGQDFQMLYCFPTTTNIVNPAWSPNGQQIIFNELSDTNSQTRAAERLLSLRGGTVQMVMSNDIMQLYNVYGWYNNQQFIVSNYNTGDIALYNWQQQKLSTIFQPKSINVTMDFACPGVCTPSNAMFALGEWQQPSGGGPIGGPGQIEQFSQNTSKTIYQNPNQGINFIRIAGNRILFQVNNTDQHTNQNGIWSVGMDGSHLVHLAPDWCTPTPLGIIASYSIVVPYAVISRDLSQYACVSDSKSHAGLYIGSVTSGPPIQVVNDSSAVPVGWTLV
jgi:transcriptional regulator with XRE-family HTH domain